MTPTRTRIGVVGALLGAGLVIVLLHLADLMLVEHDVWARRSYENRWAFRSVPSQRGALRDRFGRMLCRDEPTTRVSVYYHRFRLRHPVGAAVHGARVWTGVRDGTEVAFGYRPGGVDPSTAARELLGMPVVALRKDMLPGVDTKELWYYVVTVLAECSGVPRRDTFTALRTAAEKGARVGIGDVLPVPRAELLRRFDERLAELHEIAAHLDAAEQARIERLALEVERPRTLFDLLEELREACLTGKRWTWTEDGEVKQGSLIEDVRRPLAEEVPFELAAVLRVENDRYPGLEVEPSVRRWYEIAPDTSLRVLVGQVWTRDRTLDAGDDPPAEQDGDAAADAQAGTPQAAPERDPAREMLSSYAQHELPDDWIDTLVPEGVVDSAAAREQLQRTAELRYGYELLRRERTGVTGFEAAFDGGLSGRLGMRFVEHDRTRRERYLWSHLRVEAGEDVRVTIDLDLQRIAELAARRARRNNATHEEPERNELVEAAIAVIDADSGDVLAYAGAPLVSKNARDVPGVVWTGNGAIGSTAKPFVLIEQLESGRLGLPHTPIAEFEACAGSMPYGNKRIYCDETHGGRGRDPVRAIAESCNVFFYQAGIGLGSEGLHRAYRRFGLLEPQDAHDPFAACWQAFATGLHTARSRVDDLPGRLPQRAIGYEVQASPLMVARAYAALATGVLSEVGLRLGAPRRQVALGDLGGALEVVREGLRECTATGTASGKGRRVHLRPLRLLDELGVSGKTGTAEVGQVSKANNGWFSGYLPERAAGGPRLCFSAVVYYVPDGVHGGDAAGLFVVDFLEKLKADDALRERYLDLPGSAREGR
ncbi:MAG: hypothetical protein H6835_18845 [Planctomycetes bacterium]|nr:hypothetical protein [Planctomycetota bacterium]